MNKYLQINNFRNYDIVRIDMNNHDVFVLYGKNGEGKTNVLEAISMFSGGKGLRHSKLDDMIRYDNSNFWNITISLEDGIFSSGYIKKEKVSRRIYKVSDKNVRNLSEFSKGYYILWMTYETDRLFMMSPSERRNFIDMFCCSRFFDHQKSITDYEKLTRERLKILRQVFDNNNHNNKEYLYKWLSIIESKIVENGINIANTRMDICREIEDGQYYDSDFPIFKNFMEGDIERLIISSRENNNNNDSEGLKKCYVEELLRRREKDYFSNSTTFGPNRSDWKVFHQKNQMYANFCSAGEQKMILLGVFLSFIKQNLSHDQRTLILLLDDVIAHLDFDHRVLLFKHIKKIRKSFEDACVRNLIFLTGTDKNLFQELISENVLFLNVKENNIFEDTSEI